MFWHGCGATTIRPRMKNNLKRNGPTWAVAGAWRFRPDEQPGNDMSAYYNEIDPFATAWLRELMKAGHIAPGEVDTRSIEDVVPSDLAGFRQCHFFAGIGV